MKFDFVIGNPPYQEQSVGDNKNYAAPVYDKFIDAASTIAEKVELIHPARFLFNAGRTSKDWNEKMLNSEHFKVLHYEPESWKIFKDTDIKGGVVISYIDSESTFTPIRVFTSHSQLNSIIEKVAPKADSDSITSIIYLQTKFDLDMVYRDRPELVHVIGSDGRDKRFRNNIFDKVDLFRENCNDGDAAIIGVVNNKRVWRYINKKYIDTTEDNLAGYKAIVARVNGRGALGEALSSPFVGSPGEGYTQTFLSIGNFDKKAEADNVLKYLKTKFARIMLGAMKITQDNSKDTWKMVPLQDFSKKSKINWFAPVDKIDEQLFCIYGLSDDEKEFIRNTGKEMV